VVEENVGGGCGKFGSRLREMWEVVEENVAGG